VIELTTFNHGDVSSVAVESAAIAKYARNNNDALSIHLST